MIDTLWVAGVAMGALLLVGLPLVAGFVHLSRSGNLAPEVLWAVAPFAGLAAIVLIAQNLLYLDINLPAATAVMPGVFCFSSAIVDGLRESFSLYRSRGWPET